MTNYIVRGQRVLLTPPEIKKSAIEVNAALEKELWEEQMKKWGQLEVFAIGDEVEGIEVGNRVSVLSQPYVPEERRTHRDRRPG